jgi:hypothetical protein
MDVGFASNGGAAFSRHECREVVTQSVTQRSRNCYPILVLEPAKREKGWEINGRGEAICCVPAIPVLVRVR